MLTELLQNGVHIATSSSVNTTGWLVQNNNLWSNRECTANNNLLLVTTREAAYLLIKACDLGTEVINVVLRNPILFLAVKQQLTKRRVSKQRACGVLGNVTNSKQTVVEAVFWNIAQTCGNDVLGGLAGNVFTIDKYLATQNLIHTVNGGSHL